MDQLTLASHALCGLYISHHSEHRLLLMCLYSCRGFTDVTIRLVHKKSIKNDKLMSDSPNFLKIQGNLSHPTDSADALNQLRVQPSIGEVFTSTLSKVMYNIVGRCRKDQNEEVNHYLILQHFLFVINSQSCYTAQLKLFLRKSYWQHCVVLCSICIT